MNSVTNVDNVGKRSGISGSTLKLIALITMLIDHVAAVILVRILLCNGYDENLYIVYEVMRKIGRVAFPIYIFLMIEGFERTRSREKYIMRMTAFAVISEVPFDLAFSAQVLEFGYQNIFFTLLIGMLVMLVFEAISRREWNVWIKLGLCLVVFIAGMELAELLHTDYGAKGIRGIVAMYLFRQNRLTQIVAGSVAFLWETTAPLAFIPIAFYNGKRGLQLKYVFYLFYPLHLIVLYLICMALGMQECRVV